MKNRFAQMLYGRVIYIFETNLNKTDLPTIFDPTTYWVDVTGQDCEVGYTVSFQEGVGLVFTPPVNVPTEMTLEQAKARKIELLKATRDAREVEIIVYNDMSFDYDDKARERLRIARQAIEDAIARGEGTAETLTQEWTLADNSKADLKLADFIAINTLAAIRSGALHDKYNALKDYVETLTTVEEVNAVMFDSVIPETTEDEGEAKGDGEAESDGEEVPTSGPEAETEPETEPEVKAEEDSTEKA